jgi:hypothetical protein
MMSLFAPARRRVALRVASLLVLLLHGGTLAAQAQAAGECPHHEPASHGDHAGHEAPAGGLDSHAHHHGTHAAAADHARDGQPHTPEPHGGCVCLGDCVISGVAVAHAAPALQQRLPSLTVPARGPPAAPAPAARVAYLLPWSTAPPVIA